MIYSVYDSKVYVRELTSCNGLYIALGILGASRAECVLECLDVTKRYNVLKNLYLNAKNSIGLYSRGVRYICFLMKDRGIPVRKRKCLNYAITRQGSRFYTDTSIDQFAKVLLQTINTDEALKKLLNEELLAECCDFSNEPGNPVEGDCLQHIFGFQYECLRTIVQNRTHPGSRKSVALKQCLENMRGIIRTAGYPQCI